MKIYSYLVVDYNVLGRLYNRKRGMILKTKEMFEGVKNFKEDAKGYLSHIFTSEQLHKDDVILITPKEGKPQPFEVKLIIRAITNIEIRDISEFDRNGKLHNSITNSVENNNLGVLFVSKI